MKKEKQKKTAILKRWMCIILIYIPLFYVLTSLVSIIVFKFVPVPYTPLMVLRSIEHRKEAHYHTYKVWQPLHEIAPEMVMAVMSSEDLRFAAHHGFDWSAIRKAWRAYRSGEDLRGASTISQQTAKNVFLLPHRSWSRKGLEAFFTVGMECIWGKKRIMEVYLNVVEIGPGVYGAEAAAHYYFQKPAKYLTAGEAALLAACLPNPNVNNPLEPSEGVQNRVVIIERIMAQLSEPEWLYNRAEETDFFNFSESGWQSTTNPNTINSSWNVYSDNGYDYVKIRLPNEIPYRSHQEIHHMRIVIDLYGAIPQTTWIHQLPTKTIDQVYYQQLTDSILRIFIDLNGKQHWGYGICYEGNRLVIRVKHPPKPKIKGLRIALDAGHGGEADGAIGAMGLKEKDVNLELVMLLKAQLEKRGAEVILTRSGDYEVSMQERLDFLHKQAPDILISIHNNAGAINVQGTSTYYRHIGFRPLSIAILNRLLELGVQNAGNVGSFDFALNGSTEYPNVLIEGLFLSNPEDEAKLMDKKFKKKFVKKIVRGIEDFLMMDRVQEKKLQEIY